MLGCGCRCCCRRSENGNRKFEKQNLGWRQQQQQAASDRRRHFSSRPIEPQRHTNGRTDGRTWGQRRLRMCVAEQPASRLTRGRSNLSHWPTSGRHHSIVCKHGHLFHLSCCQPSINQTDGRCCCRLAIDSRRDIDCAIFGHTNSGGGGKGGELGRRRHLITYCWLSLAARLLGSQPAARSPAIEGRLAERRRPSSAAGAQSHS